MILLLNFFFVNAQTCKLCKLPLNVFGNLQSCTVASLLCVLFYFWCKLHRVACGGDVSSYFSCFLTYHRNAALKSGVFVVFFSEVMYLPKTCYIGLHCPFMPTKHFLQSACISLRVYANAMKRTPVLRKRPEMAGNVFFFFITIGKYLDKGCHRCL